MTETSSIDGKVANRISLDSEDIIYDWLNQPHRPTLIVSCKGRKTDLVVHAGTPAQTSGLSDGVRVRIRIDDKPVEAQVWDESTNYEAFFSPAPTVMVRRLLKAKRLYFSFVVFQRAEQSVEFHLDGFQVASATIAKQCGW